jgi:ClpP class serine protease
VSDGRGKGLGYGTFGPGPAALAIGVAEALPSGLAGHAERVTDGRPGDRVHSRALAGGRLLAVGTALKYGLFDEVVDEVACASKLREPVEGVGGPVEFVNGGYLCVHAHVRDTLHRLSRSPDTYDVGSKEKR